MKIIVLAAGEGKRMWPIQTDKCLIPFLGKPLLRHNLKKIKENLEGEYVIVVSSKNRDGVEKIAKELGLSYKIAIQNEPKGMADAILSVQSGLEGEVLVVNAEDIVDASIYREVLETGGEVVVPGLQVKNYFPGGYLKVEGERVKGILEKPGEGREPSDLVKLVVDYFRDGKKLVSYLEKVSSEEDDQYEIALDQMIADGMDVRFVKYEGIWIPLKYPWHILDVMAYFLAQVKQQISPTAKVSEKAIIEGDVMIEDGVKVFEGAVVKGPAYLGKNCIVGNHSMVRQSNLEEGCVTGFNSDITRSYIGANSWFHTNYVGDSILEGDFGMGSGAVLANLRLDDRMIAVGEARLDTGRHKLGLIAGRGVRIGVNAATMPGVKVGANSLIGPGVILRSDIKENTKVMVKQEHQVSEHAPILISYDQFRDKLK
ncbi:MAG: sugar phosphate nucleotidyltransferase [Candidatus Daviesbacteria bacterium]|nr:sugar phosphate nucleotidyltransferase [Candidatus Daviesbacteria bacterium]